MPQKAGTDPVIVCRQLSKSYGNIQAIDRIDLDVTAGTVHALVGENGAGKSTFLGVLAGRISPSKGTAHIFGQELPYGEPRDIRRIGVAAIYQELMVVPELSAQANVYLGQSLSRGGVLREQAMQEGFDALCQRLGVRIPPTTPAGSLAVAEQQMLEIMRALVASARVVLFDEPTAALPPQDREGLFKVIADLRAQGVTIMFVSHNLDEVLEIADIVTVFRDGRLAVSAPVGEWTKPSLVEAMLGHAATIVLTADEIPEDEGASKSTRSRSGRQSDRAVLLRAEKLTVPHAIEDITIEVRAGEIVGLSGLVGSGRTTALRALAGLEPQASGRLWIEGQEVPWPRTVRDARRLGIALLPEDRKLEGLVLGMSAMDNIVMSDFSSVSRGGFISDRRAIKSAAKASAEFGIPAERLTDAAGNLSGGNQQKLLLARWRHSAPKILLADEPTRGIDVGAKVEILGALRRMAADGKGVMLASSELEEVAAVSDRVVVLAEGRQVAEIDGNDRNIDVQEILRAAFKVERAS